MAAGGFNALTIYIWICMIFIALAMMYYGLILFKLRKIFKVEAEDDEKSLNRHAIKISNSIIKVDRVMLIVYLILFILLNVCYFIIYSV